MATLTHPAILRHRICLRGIFNSADVAVITKLDLAGPVGCDLEALVRNIHGVRPGMPVLQVSTRSGQGIQELEQFLAADRTKPVAAQAV